MHTNWASYLTIIVAFVAAGAGVGITAGNWEKLSTLESEFRGWFLKFSVIVSKGGVLEDVLGLENVLEDRF